MENKNHKSKNDEHDENDSKVLTKNESEKEELKDVNTYSISDLVDIDDKLIDDKMFIFIDFKNINHSNIKNKLEVKTTIDSDT